MKFTSEIIQSKAAHPRMIILTKNIITHSDDFEEEYYDAD